MKNKLLPDGTARIYVGDGRSARVLRTDDSRVFEELPEEFAAIVTRFLDPKHRLRKFVALWTGSVTMNGEDGKPVTLRRRNPVRFD